MKAPLASVAPLVLTAAPVGWLLWGLIGSSAPEPARVKPVRVDSALLSPALGEGLARDPFARAQPGGNSSPVRSTPKVEVAAPTPKSVAANPPSVARTDAASPAPRRSEGLATLRATVVAAATRWQDFFGSAQDRVRAAQEFQAEVASQVRLSATSVRGRVRTAILNDRCLSEGQILSGLDTARGPVIVAEVRAGSVVLRGREALAVVSFPSPTRLPGPKGGAATLAAVQPDHRRPPSRGTP